MNGIHKIDQWFTIREFVCDHVYDKLGESAWRLFDPRLFAVMAWLRLKLNRRIIINSRSQGFTQRGLRCTKCALVKNRTDAGVTYLSPHILGAAVDFDVEGMMASEVRQWIEANKRLLPYSIRLEDKVNWVHLDVATLSEEKVTYFQP
jgi:hypothetical protein